MATTLPSLEAWEEKKNNVSFGTTANRPLFPGQLPPNRLGTKLSHEASPHRAPGTYDNDETITSCPSHYQTRCTEPRTFEMANKPFHTGHRKFHKLQVDPEITPGAGTYEHNVPKNRKVAFHGTFGGPQLLKIPPDDSVLLPVECKGTTQKSRLMTYKDKRKFAIREAYLSLYY